MDNYEYYLKQGEEMLYDGMLEGISRIKDKVIRDSSVGYWTGELTWDEHVKIISDDFNKRIENEIKRLLFGDIPNKDKFKMYINKINK